jgi:hypothetical protein
MKIRSVRRRAVFIALGLFTVMSAAGGANAGSLTTVNNTDATALAAALTSGGAGGITVTNATVSTNQSGALASSGVFSTVGTNNYGLAGSGVVISTGDAAQDGTTGAFINGVSTSFGTNANAAQTALLNQVSPASNDFHDVTQLTVTFNASATTNQVFFNTVFGSAEYPVFVGQFIDGFGLFLNGTNIAFAGGQAVNIDSSLMVNTGFPINGGVDGSQFQTTPLGGLLVQNGTGVVTYSGDVIPGSIGNTLIFIVGDANDNNLDTAAFIQGLGNAAPLPETPLPAALPLFATGLGAMGLLGWRRKRKVASLAA